MSRRWKTNTRWRTNRLYRLAEWIHTTSSTITAIIERLVGLIWRDIFRVALGSQVALVCNDRVRLSAPEVLDVHSPSDASLRIRHLVGFDAGSK